MGVTEHACTGVEHLGRRSLVGLAALLALAGTALVASSKRIRIVAAVGSVPAVVVTLALGWDAGFLRHLLEDVGPDARVVGAFDVLLRLSVPVALALCLCTFAERPPD